MNRYVIVVEDNQMLRQPQTIQERHVVIAHTAEDAITIAQVRHNFPMSETVCGDDHWRKLKDIEPQEATA